MNANKIQADKADLINRRAGEPTGPPAHLGRGPGLPGRLIGFYPSNPLLPPFSFAPVCGRGVGAGVVCNGGCRGSFV